MARIFSEHKIFSINRLNDSHKEAWSCLWRKYLAFYKTERSDEIIDLAFARLTQGHEECEAYIASADNKKAKGVYWLTQDFNIKARNLYDKIGVKTAFIKYTRT